MKPTVIQIVGIENTNQLQDRIYKTPTSKMMLTVGIEFMTTEKKNKIKYKLQYKCLKFTN